MASLTILNKLTKWQKFVFPINAHNRIVLSSTIANSMRTLHTENKKTSANTYTVSRAHRRHYADEIKSKVSLDEFRAREEQREREANMAKDAQEKLSSCTDQKTSSNAEDEATKSAKVESVRIKILDAALAHVPRLGWTREAIVCGAEDCGLPSAVHGLFPEDGFALVSHFNSKSNEALVQYLQQQTDNGNKVVDNPLDFLVNAVRHRLEMILPYKAQWPQAMALIAMPQNASTALAHVLTLVDDICYYSGDRSVDFGWYTRRIGLATIMKMTELYMLQDTSPQQTATWEFLKNRMDEAVQLQMMLAQTEGMTHNFQRSFNSAFVTARNILGLGYNRN